MILRILHIVPDLRCSGATQQLALMASRLPRDKFEVHICTLRTDDQSVTWRELRQQGIPVHDIAARPRRVIRTYRRLRQLIRRLRPEIVHTWRFEANSLGRSAALAEHVPHLVASQQPPAPNQSWYHGWSDHFFAGRSARIVVNGPAIRAASGATGLAADKLVCVAGGVDVPFGQPPSHRSQALRAQLNLPPHSWLIGAVGDLHPRKRLKDAIWSADLLKLIRKDVHLVIIGEGRHRWRLQRYQRLIGIEDRVHLLGYREDVPQLLPQMNCFWNTSGYEQTSRAVMEAMATGLPVVATNIPGNRALVQDGGTGYLIGVGDRANIARRTLDWIDNPDHARVMGAAGRQLIQQRFPASRCVQEYRNLYEQLATARAPQNAA